MKVSGKNFTCFILSIEQTTREAPIAFATGAFNFNSHIRFKPQSGWQPHLPLLPHTAFLFCTGCRKSGDALWGETEPSC